MARGDRKAARLSLISNILEDLGFSQRDKLYFVLAVFALLLILTTASGSSWKPRYLRHQTVKRRQARAARISKKNAEDAKKNKEKAS